MSNLSRISQLTGELTGNTLQNFCLDFATLGDLR